MMFLGVTIVSNPAGTAVSGSTNTFDYPILSSVTLTCNVMPDSGSLPAGITYQWNSTGCYTNTRFTGNNPECFPHGQTSRSVTGNNLNAEDAGTISCTAIISNVLHTSEPLTLRISGEQLMYCEITCIVYCKQCMLLLLATCYCCIIHQLLWFMYRGVFTVGVVVIRGNNFDSTNALTDYSYINPISNGALLARCMTGLGPSGNDNSVLGGWYFNGNKIPNEASCSSNLIQPIPGGSLAGANNIVQCSQSFTAAEGVYTCTMVNSSMMDQSVRLGIYYTVRCELRELAIYPTTLPSFISLHSCSSDRHSIIIYCNS